MGRHADPAYSLFQRSSLLQVFLPSHRKIGEDRNPTILNRLSFAMGGSNNSTYGPTPLLNQSYEIAEKEFKVFKAKLDEIVLKQLPEFEKSLIEAGAPWVEGQPIPE